MQRFGILRIGDSLASHERLNMQCLLPEDSFASIENARGEFEIPGDLTYLNCANMAPQSRSVTKAGRDAVSAKASPWKLTASDWFSGAETLRSLAAKLFGVDSDGIALVPAVSYGIAIAAANLPLSPNQTIVLIDQEFPSNLYAWRESARRAGARMVTVKRSNGMN